MHTYIALFRGINVGGKRSLPMGDLVAILESAKLENIRTCIQSGNVVFQCRRKLGKDKAAEISDMVLENKGFAPLMLLLEDSELLAAIENNPFPDADGKSLHCYFLESPPRRADRDRLQALQQGSEQYHLDPRVLYLYAPGGIGRSRLAAGLEKALGVLVTARNWNTVRKLGAMVTEV